MQTLLGRQRRAVDSTILADAVATEDTITQLVGQIRRVARVVPGAAEQVAAVCTGYDYHRPGKPEIDGDGPTSDADATPRREWYGDSAYGTGDLRGAIHDAGHEAVIKPKPLRPAVEGGFTTDDFTIDQIAGTITCPNQVTRTLTPSRYAVFGAACRTCPLRQRCTTSKDGRTIRLHPHDALLRQARRDWTNNPDLPDRYRQHRPHIERVISRIATIGRRRLRLPYRGTAANNAWLKRRTAALNLRNLINRGLRHAD